MRLLECLENSTWRTLRAIAWHRRARFDFHATKEQNAAALASQLGHQRSAAAALEGLSSAEMDALQTLIIHDGELPAPEFERRFGSIRPIKPRRKGGEEPTWKEPSSPAERLYYLGLIFKTARPSPDSQGLYIIPADILPLLPKPPDSSLLEKGPPPQKLEEMPADEAMVRDTFCFVSFLNCHEVRLLRGQRLPIGVLRSLNERFFDREDLSHARSERESGRTRFIHGLCWQAGLVAQTGHYLKPTPSAHDWLRSSHQARLLTLWQAWKETQAWDEVARSGLASRQPSDPVMRRRFLAILESGPAGEWFTFDSFLRMLEGTQPPLVQEGFKGPEGATAHELSRALALSFLVEPLYWLGAVSIQRDPSGGLSSFQLTARGGRLLAEEVGEAGAPEHRPWSIDEGLRIAVPWKADLSALFHLESFADLASPGRTSIYQLSQASVYRGLARGMSLERMVSVLEDGIGDALPVGAFSALERWAGRFGEVSISREALLEARDRSLLKKLYTSREFKGCFKRLISPRIALVRQGKVEILVEKLKELGYMPELDERAIPEAAPPSGRTDGQAIYFLLTGLIYARLSEAFGLPMTVPSSLLAELEGQLSPAQREEVRAAVQEAVARIEGAFEGDRGEVSGDKPPLPGLPLEQVVPQLERAIEGEAPLCIGYLDSRGRLTQRLIEPYLVEERKGRFYLVAYCHLRGAERVFRLDRISRIEPACQGVEKEV